MRNPPAFPKIFFLTNAVVCVALAGARVAGGEMDYSDSSEEEEAEEAPPIFDAPSRTRCCWPVASGRT